MPVDQKRINGPEVTVPYQLYVKTAAKSLRENYNNLVKTGRRKDGRRLDEHRETYIKTEIITKAKGSAYMEQGKTRVIVAVFDPKEIPNRTEYYPKGEVFCEFKFAPFSCTKRKLYQQDAEEKKNSFIIKKSLEPAIMLHNFPNFQLDIYILVLHDDGSALSAAITAAGAAIGSAGIPMYDSISSSTLAIQGDLEIVDPTRDEEMLGTEGIEDKHGLLVLSYLPTHEQISQFYEVGYLSVPRITKGIFRLTEVCKKLIPIPEKVLIKPLAIDIIEEEEI